MVDLELAASPVQIVVQLTPPEAHNATIGAKPQVAQIIFQHRADRIGTEAIARGHFRKPPVLESAQAPVHCPDPQRVFPVHKKRPNVVVSQPILSRIAAKPSVAQVA
jgi:hypothetical protein